jgi:hypothetical protein
VLEHGDRTGPRHSDRGGADHGDDGGAGGHLDVDLISWNKIARASCPLIPLARVSITTRSGSSSATSGEVRNRSLSSANPSALDHPAPQPGRSV